MIARWILALLLSTLLVEVSSASQPHPAYLELRELAPGDFRVLWKQPVSGASTIVIEPVFPDHCIKRTLPTLQPHVSASVEHWVIRCGKQSLGGQQLGVDGLPIQGGEAFLKLSMINGLSYQAILRPVSPFFRVPNQTDPVSRNLKFLVLGVEQVLTGIDHLLFLIGLMLLTRSPGALWIALMGFMVGYSATLSMALLEGILLPPVLTSSLVSLSILYIASELCKRYQGRGGQCVSAPWLIAVCFGLVHGLDFSTTLSAEQIPEVDIAIALLFFSIGVLAGPLVLLLPVVVVKQLIRFHTQRALRWEMGIPAYGMGALAALWFIESTASF